MSPKPPARESDIPVQAALHTSTTESPRPISAPPSGALGGLPSRSKTLPATSSAAQVPLVQRVLSDNLAAARSSQSPTPIPSAVLLDLMPQLQRSTPSAVKTRTGSVLSRGFILKTDHYPSGRALDLELNVHGAPNFRAPRNVNLNVFGVAQPRTQGLRGILSILRCRPNIPNPTHVVWFCTREEPIVYISGRPFVLRDAAEPRRTLTMSDRAENLEAIELRLKNDILVEAAKYGGLILTHNEVASDSGEGAILPTWTAIDTGNVRTTRELMEQMREAGWNLEYHRIPISPDRPIEDNYLDAYARIIQQTDPFRTALVFNCGMGAVRTTFAMVAACIVRRKQLIERGLEDTYSPRSPAHRSGTSTPSGSQVTDTRIMQGMEQAGLQQDLNRSLLRITSILQQTLQAKNSQNAIELLVTQPDLLESLRKAHMGNYGIILSLLGTLEQGVKAKKLVDRVIDSCDQVTNLREDIFMHRVDYSLTTMDEAGREQFLVRAVKSIEKYFFLIAFANYVEISNNLEQTFSDWLKARTEIWNQIMFLRRTYGSRLSVFQPIGDLSALSKSGAEGRALVAGKQNDVTVSGGQVLGDEYSDHVVKHRSGIILREGMLLKSDQWLRESQQVTAGVRGAINFRNIPGTMIYALGQPTLQAVDLVVDRVREANPDAKKILWLCLREEPIVYVNGAPYCLRRERTTLRNMKDYGGISASRLEVLEERLRDDVVAEVGSFGGRLLLHTETPDGSVIPIWEEIDNEDVSVLKDVMSSRKHLKGSVELSYLRIPITAERPPDFSDLTEMIEVALRNPNTPIVVNCQLGRGRSTMAAIILVLITKWLEQSAKMVAPSSPRLTRSLTTTSLVDGGDSYRHDCHSYQIIDNLLRVIRKGPTVKNAVDDAIDQCAEVYNLRNSIEESRVLAEQSTDERTKRQHAQRGLHNLRRYFELIIFQAYLQSIQPDTMQTFETIEMFVKDRPVIKTFEKELIADGVNALKPLERLDAQEGVALPDEVRKVVANRSGVILSASTIVKSDFFSNLQKMTLPERIEGAPNFRRVPLALRRIKARATSPSQEPEFVPITDEDRWVCGSGMPTVDGLRKALLRVDAGPNGKSLVHWTSLREEPVVYIAGRPHVLRLIERPLENVEATGITTEVVERMEDNFKRDVLKELRAQGGRILLHDEVEERPGVYSIIPIWQEAKEEDIMTPRNVFELMAREGYHVDYSRVAITDEQAPLPAALQQLMARVRSTVDGPCDFVFNCQMGRGRTTTGMIVASLVATTLKWDKDNSTLPSPEESGLEIYDSIDGPSEEEAYLQGEYKTILQLVAVLSHGKIAKRLTDYAIDLMQDVQNLRKAIYDYKLKVEACEKGSAKQQKLLNIGINYLYRYGTLIVFANYLIEIREQDEPEKSFPEWLQEHREITKLLSRRSLD